VSPLPLPPDVVGVSDGESDGLGSLSSAGGGDGAQDGRLHPRVAVALGIDPRYHKWLMIARASSIFPCIIGLAKCIFVAWRYWLGDYGFEEGIETTMKEIGLAAGWSIGAGYQSFRFTDSLMTRWYYHPLLPPLTAIN